MEREVMTLKESKKEHKGRLRGMKVKGEMMQLYNLNNKNNKTGEIQAHS